MEEARGQILVGKCGSLLWFIKGHPIEEIDNLNSWLEGLATTWLEQCWIQRRGLRDG